MKVVLFCGGQGMRIRDYSESVPKPMVPIGNRPVLWHVMKNYALAGHSDFILTLGHGATAIKRFFLEYDEAESNDFVLENGSRRLLGSDLDDWSITFVDTGVQSDIGERLVAVREHLDGEERFLVNYADGLADIDHNGYIERFDQSGKRAAITVVKPPMSYHFVEWSDDDALSFTPISESGVWVNGGFFIFEQSIFDLVSAHAREGGDAFNGAVSQLMEDRQMFVNPHTGFWMPMDTFKEKVTLDALVEKDDVPWLRAHG